MKLIVAGVGPGDSGMVTTGALRALDEADLVPNTIKIAFVDSSSLKNALKKVVIFSRISSSTRMTVIFLPISPNPPRGMICTFGNPFDKKRHPHVI